MHQNHKQGDRTYHKSSIFCLVLYIFVIMIADGFSKSHLAYSQLQSHTSFSQPILVGIWVGKEISLTLKPDGQAMLQQFNVLRSKESQNTTDGRATPGHQPQLFSGLRLIGFWWETSHAHQRSLCLFFDLTAHCSPVMISSLQPNELIIRLGRSQAILHRQVVLNPRY